MNFILGEKLSSYERLKEKISAYEYENNIQLVYNNDELCCELCCVVH